MPKAKEPTVTFFCSHCGETKTYLVSDERLKPKSCKACLQGEMLEAVNLTTPETT